ncbi:MAG: hypothetical protein ONB23_05775 [candidate division KSB1 bacterium]|nr:hypothetical protein [candidate division KSB1 bacterium]
MTSEKKGHEVPYPGEVAELLEIMAGCCPRALPGERPSPEDFEVRPANDSSGWFFRCTACAEFCCVGFIARKRAERTESTPH